MAKSKQTMACDIDAKTRKKVYDRDGHMCIVCGNRQVQVAHFIGRAQGGLGIKENLICLCPYHHELYDGVGREVLQPALRAYLRGWYPDWDEANLKYDKYEFLKGVANEET